MALAVFLAWWCGGWLLLELLFWVIVKLLLTPRLHRSVKPAEYDLDPEELVCRILKAVSWLNKDDPSFDMHAFLRGWFLDTSTEEICYDNMVEFLCFTMYAATEDDVPEEKKQIIRKTIDAWEASSGFRFQRGRNPEAVCMRHTIEPVECVHRPLALYALLGGMRVAMRYWMRSLGFKCLRTSCGTRYWHRDSESAQLPFVFFHGLGCGLPMYAKLVKTMCLDREALLIENPSISMSLHHLRNQPAQSEEEFVECISSICDRHQIKKAAFSGHSFGSIGVTWITRNRPDLVGQIAMVDPVCILLFLPHVARNFLYTDMSKLSTHGKILKQLVAKEKGINHTLRRHFWWYNSILWPEDVPCPMTVGLCGRDEIVPSEMVHRYLRDCPDWHREVTPVSGASKPTQAAWTDLDAAAAAAPGRTQVCWWPKFKHGDPLLVPGTLERFKAAVQVQADYYGLKKAGTIKAVPEQELEPTISPSAKEATGTMRKRLFAEEGLAPFGSEAATLNSVSQAVY
ncbi:unnamed protein product [Chrysoparadoxa australica]